VKKDPRPFFFKTKKSAINAWYRIWTLACLNPENQMNLLSIDKKIEEDYMQTGIACVANYWEANYKLPRPMGIEVRYKYPIPGRGNVWLLGIVDQLRKVSTGWIENHRPELIKNGKLDPDYDPVVIFDIKTEKDRYETDDSKEIDWKKVAENPDLRQTKKVSSALRQQFKLHEEIQATFYTWLYHMHSKKRPIGFYNYNPRWNKGYFTYRTDEDYPELFKKIYQFLDDLNVGRFLPNIGTHCKTCGFFEACQGEKPFKFSFGEHEPPGGLDTSELDDKSIIHVGDNKKPPKQLRLKLKTERKKREPRIEVEPETAQIVIPELPWEK
jgi:hypothetical protein